MMAVPESAVSSAHCIGPDYRPEESKPTATVSTQISYDNVHILAQTPQLIALLTYVGRLLDLALLKHGEVLNIFCMQYDSRSRD